MSSQIQRYGATDIHRGVITVQIDDSNYVKLAIDSSFTDFETLQEGASVRVEYDQLSSHDDLAAMKIRLVKEVRE